MSYIADKVRIRQYRDEKKKDENVRVRIHVNEDGVFEALEYLEAEADNWRRLQMLGGLTQSLPNDKL